jgi:hypothetical protein
LPTTVRLLANMAKTAMRGLSKPAAPRGIPMELYRKANKRFWRMALVAFADRSRASRTRGGSEAVG